MRDKILHRALFIFRRDLRLADNTGLLFALKNAEEVIPAFIFTKTQTQKNPYHSEHAFQFMLHSLQDLDDSLQEHGSRLSLFLGDPEKVVEECIENLKLDAVVVNEDYTPYSIQRDKKIQQVCQKKKVNFHSCEDLLLHPKELLLKSDGSPYLVFTPFYKNALKIPVEKPQKNSYQNYYKKKIPFAQAKIESFLKKDIICEGGRKQGLQRLKKAKSLTHYKTQRDIPSLNYTSHLSPHLKFTTCSPREVYHALAGQTDLLRSLYWRDFFTLIAFHFPHVFQGCFHSHFDKIRWSHNPEFFKKWCLGQTGFPIVDAGMRELNATGTMHNRVRMITASFLIKDLHIDWRQGEQYFAQKLTDYDPCVNNGNWQWVASTGCDAQPYFRIFNPWNQQKRFDPDCEYIKKWVPELKSLSSQEIHGWASLKDRKEIDYPLPLVDHTVESKSALKSYKNHAH